MVIIQDTRRLSINQVRGHVSSDRKPEILSAIVLDYILGVNILLASLIVPSGRDSHLWDPI